MLTIGRFRTVKFEKIDYIPKKIIITLISIPPYTNSFLLIWGAQWVSICTEYGEEPAIAILIRRTQLYKFQIQLT